MGEGYTSTDARLPLHGGTGNRMRVLVVAIGATTHRALGEAGVRCHATCDTPGPDGLAKALASLD